MKTKKIMLDSRKWVLDNPIVVAVVILAVIMSVFVPNFFTVRNFISLLQQMSIIGISAVGLTFVIIGGGNDLSVGSTITLSAIVSVYAMVAASGIFGVFVGISAGVAAGCAIGIINGFMVAKVGVNAFVMTIVMQMLIEGMAIFITKAGTVRAPREFSAIGTGNVLGIPNVVIIMVLFFIIGQLILKRMVFGRKVYAIGANEKAATLVGIPVVKIRIITFVMCSVFAAIAGLLMSSRLGAATAGMGSFLFLDIISAVIIGGTSIFGGKGNIIGTLFGVLILGLISNGFNLIGIEYNQTLIVKGAVILLAIIIEVMRGKVESKRMLGITLVRTSE